jgi:hypothetical protein
MNLVGNATIGKTLDSRFPPQLTHREALLSNPDLKSINNITFNKTDDQQNKLMFTFDNNLNGVETKVSLF